MKTVFICFFCVLCFDVFSQSNLQFNRVITYSGSVTENIEILLDSVPPNKVWKIEAKGISGLGSVLKINGKKYTNVVLINQGFTTSALASVNEVIWLKEGDKISVSYYIPQGSNYVFYNFDYVYSVIEFSLTP